MVARAPRPAPRAAGFTLPEALAVLVIVAVLGAIGAPAGGSLIDGQRARSASTDLFSALLMARSEAIKRNTEVTLLPVATDGSWQSGWTIPNPVDSGHPIATHGAVNNATITGPASVVYLASGRVKGLAKPAFDIALPRAASHRCVQVDLSGRPLATAAGCAP
jgi:type IV fimbrial biogenesis protein FimT